VRIREEWDALRSLETALAVADAQERVITLDAAVQRAKRITDTA
jgi:hypothetical protein